MAKQPKRIYAIRLEEDVVARIDADAAKHRTTRSELIRHYIDRALGIRRKP